MTMQQASRIETARENIRARVVHEALAPRRLLCATDLSARSHRALLRALAVAKPLGAQVTLLHVRDPQQLADESVHDRSELARSIGANDLPSNQPVDVQVRSGNFVETIALVARETNADLIVLGSQQRRPWASLVGTTAEQVIALSGIPALIVNLPSTARYRGVVIAAELSDSFVQVVRTAASLRFLDGEPISVVHGFESPYRGPLYAEGFNIHAARRNMEEWERLARTRLLRNLDLAGVESSRFRLVFHQSRPLRAIQSAVRSVQPDLLVIGTKDRSIFNRLARGSVANDTLRSADCDILVAASQSVHELSRQ
jgi:nucleotide-binding universal stress UspA family protein